MSLRLEPRRIAVLMLFLALTLAVLFGAQRLLFLTQTKQPLQLQLQGLPAVRSVSLQLQAPPETVTVTLGKVADLQQTYADIARRVRAVAPGAALVVRGSADARLTSVEEALSFPIEQGLASGQFVAMRSAVLTEAGQLHVQARIYVDGHNVYLALYGAHHAAYYIYPRGAH